MVLLSLLLSFYALISFRLLFMPSVMAGFTVVDFTADTMSEDRVCSLADSSGFPSSIHTGIPITTHVLTRTATPILILSRILTPHLR